VVSLVDKHVSSLNSVGEGPKRRFRGVLQPTLASFQPALPLISSPLPHLPGEHGHRKGDIRQRLWKIGRVMHPTHLS